LIFLSGVALYFIVINVRLQHSLIVVTDLKEKDFQLRKKEAKKEMTVAFEGGRGEEKVTYEALFKKLEVAKKRASDLQAQLKLEANP
jgi:hypothetical protein